MGVMCMLLDKERQYTALLSDIFSVTGHKLLIATEEEKAVELLQKASPEVILIPLEDFGFWFKLMEMEHYLFPVVFLEKEEDLQNLRAYGLEESNAVVLPFNPMELLTKVVSLAKNLEGSQQTEFLSFTNLLLKLLRQKLTFSLMVQAKESSCTLIVEEGRIKGITCPVKELSELLSEEVTLKLLPFQQEEVWRQFRDNWEFFSELFRTALPEAPTRLEETPPTPAQTVSIAEKEVDLDQPVELESNFYWVGVPDRTGLFQRNVYLRIYQKEGIQVPVLINLGTAQDFLFVKTKVEQLLGSVGALRGVILLGSYVEEASGVLALLQANQKIFVISSVGIANRLRALGIPQSRMRTLETLPEGRMRLASGDVLRFIPTPFLPEVGSFVVLEENTGRLFTGRFLSSLCTFEDFSPLRSADLADFVMHASVHLPSRELLDGLLSRLPTESITSIYPMFGNPVLSQEGVKWLLSKLEGLQGLPRAGDGLQEETVLKACQSILDFLKANMDTEEFNSLVEELGHHLYVEEGRITQLITQPEVLPSAVLGIMQAKKVRPELVKESVKLLYVSGVPFTI